MPVDPLDRQATAADLFKLAEEGILSRKALDRAVAEAGLYPGPSSWSIFFDRFFLLFGSVLTLSGIIYFFAYNWEHLGRFTKFGLLESAIAAAAALAWVKGPDRLTGKTALFSAAVLVGPLLAVYGQTYQTGADAHELFLTWLILIAGWAVIARFAPLWLLMVILANTWFVLYWEQIVKGRVKTRETTLLIVMAVINTLFWLGWEEASRRGIGWMAHRWYSGLLAATAITWLTFFGVVAIFERKGPLWLFPLMAAVILAYALARCRDPFILAATFLSLIVTSTSLIIRVSNAGDGAFLFIGVFVAALTAGAAILLRKIQRRWEETG